MLDELIRKNLLTARGVYGFFPANSSADDVEVYTDNSRSQVLTRFHFLRQQIEKTEGQPNLCLADFIAPKDGFNGPSLAGRLKRSVMSQRMVITFIIRYNTNISRSTGNGFSISAPRAGKLNSVKAAVQSPPPFYFLQTSFTDD